MHFNFEGCKHVCMYYNIPILNHTIKFFIELKLDSNRKKNWTILSVRSVPSRERYTCTHKHTIIYLTNITVKLSD